MTRLIQSAAKFIRGTWLALLFAFSAVKDPLEFGKGFGVVNPDVEWVLGASNMRGLFAIVAIVWAFWWFHKNQTNWEDSQSPTPDIALDKSVDADSMREIIDMATQGTISLFGLRRINHQSDRVPSKIPPNILQRADYKWGHRAHYMLPLDEEREEVSLIWDNLHVSKRDVLDNILLRKKVAKSTKISSNEDQWVVHFYGRN